MTKRESILGAALLFAVVAGATLFMQLRSAQQQAGSALVTGPETLPTVTPPATAASTTPVAATAQAPAPMPAPVPAVSQDAGPAPVIPAPPPLLPGTRPPVARTASVAGSPAIISSNDQDGDGIVTREEARLAGAALDRMWDFYDTNRDGRVEAGEVDQRNAEATEARSSPGGLAASIMANNDLDRDGVITREEARVANGALNSTWNQYDRNRDGKVVPAEIRGPR